MRIPGRILLLCLLPPFGGLAAENGAPPSTGQPREVVAAEPAGKPKDEGVPASSGLNAARLLPLGVPCKGVRMPEFTNDVLVSRIRARELKRINDDQLHVTEMEMERYRADGTLDNVVTVEDGFYELESGKLTSQHPTRVRGRSFDIRGQGCDYARGAPVIRILGNVVSYFYPDRMEKPPGAPPTAQSDPQPPQPSPGPR